MSCHIGDPRQRFSLFALSLSLSYLSIKIQSRKLSLDLSLGHNTIHGEDDVPAIPGDDHIVPDIIIQQAANTQRRHDTCAQVHIQHHSVLDQLQCKVISLGATRVQEHSVLIRGLEAELDGLPGGCHRIPQQVQ